MLRTFIYFAVVLTIGAAWLGGADTLIAGSLVTPHYDASAYWYWINGHPWLGFVGAFMNILGLSVVFTVMEKD